MIFERQLIRLWPVLFLLTLWLMVGCTPQQPRQDAPALAVATLTVSTPEQAPQRSFNGRVVAADLTRLAFRIDGKLAQLTIRPGQSVQQGQVLATLVDRTQQQALTDARAQFNLIERQLRRAEKLLIQGSVSDAEMDELRANWRLARANLKAAQAQLRYTTLTAPFDGVIAELYKERFETLSPGEPIATLYRADRMDVQIPVPDSLLTQIDPEAPSIGYAPEARIDGFAEPVAMRYLEHTLELDPQSRAFQLWLSMPAPSQKWRPGLPATITVDMAKAGLSLPQGYRVPLSALQAAEQPGTFRVWKVVDNRAQPHAVSVSAVTQSGALVDSGLNQGDVLILSGLSRLMADMVVNPKPMTE
ncbi:efflux RND transporter periplasmic adaptor subunit [Ferrimonas balearica]|uniref:efflux RND transporter periplasmic adaptor subunit n=1 Tax=Ferrimonas balearica TaxID=44012 RepID=UPI001C55E269|nr:efflux RND transporter periplasmic adaptor subunit [Ferrimonas balearica]MBW3139286.1 efflux RND transporter periplasmic adaptor subunit [Ferrimonas balearica]